MRVLFLKLEPSQSLWRFWKFFRIRVAMLRRGKTTFIELFWQRALIFFAVLGLALYLTGVTAIWLFLDTHERNRVTWLDVSITPINLATIREKRGQADIELGMDLLEQRAIREGVAHLRKGILRDRDNFEARLELARIYAAGRRPDFGMDVLEGGFHYGEPESEEYYDTLLALSQISRDYPRLTRVLPMLLEMPRFQEDVEERTAILRLLLRAHLLGEDYLELFETAETINQDDSLELKVYDYGALALQKQGDPEAALEYLRRVPEATKKSPRFLALEGAILAKLNRVDEAMTNVRHVFLRFPQDWSRQIEALGVLLQMDAEVVRNHYLAFFVAQHGENEAAMARLAKRFSQMPDADAVGDLRANYERRVPEISHGLLSVELRTLISEGRFDEATRLFERWQEMPVDPDFDRQMDLYSLLLLAAREENAAVAQELHELLRKSRYLPEIYYESARAIFRVGISEKALNIVNTGLEFFPHEPLLIQLKRDIEAGEFRETVDMESDFVRQLQIPENPGR